MIELESSRRKFCVALVGLLFVAIFAAGPSAADRGARNGAGDGGQLSIVEKVDVGNRTLTLGGQVYSVPQSAELEDADGNRITLSRIHGVGTRRSADLVEIWTRRSGRQARPEITRLQIKPAMSF